jgi:GTP-binding protein
MIIRSAKFIKSSAKLSECPKHNSPEFAFIGRSNVGKSSLINMITGHSKLAKISGTPGKTQTINHFLINDEWYLVDLPGYGYAKSSATRRAQWGMLVDQYVKQRETLACLFVLIDCRIEPQKSDLIFMEMLGTRQIPFARVFTKSDKLRPRELRKAVADYNETMKETWEEMPATFISSTENKAGREELLNFIEQTINIFRNGS